MRNQSAFAIGSIVSTAAALLGILLSQLLAALSQPKKSAAKSDAIVLADPAAPVSARPVKVIEVHDGDSLKCAIDLGYGFSFTPPGGIRAYGYDAWEVSRTRQAVGEITEIEILKGKLARDEFAELCKAGQLYAEDSGERDPYGRCSAVLWVKVANGEWIYVARWMENRGHLRVPLAKRPAS